MINWLSNNIQIEELICGRPVTSGLMLAAFVAVVALTIYLYMRRQGLPLKVRITLALARLIVLSLIVVSRMSKNQMRPLPSQSCPAHLLDVIHWRVQHNGESK